MPASSTCTWQCPVTHCSEGYQVLAALQLPRAGSGSAQAATLPTLQVCLGPCCPSLSKDSARCGLIFKTRAGSGQQTKGDMETAAVSFPAQAKQLISAPLLIPTILLGLTSPSPWLHRRAFSSSLKTDVTSPRKTGLTLSSLSAPSQAASTGAMLLEKLDHWDAEQKPQGHSPRQTQHCTD